MRIAISALNLSTESGFTNAGISRYCFGLIDALHQLPDKHEYIVFLRKGVEPPQHWKADSRFKFVGPRGPRRKSLSIAEIIGGSLQVRKYKPQVYLSTAHAVPMFCKCPKAMVVHDLFPVTHPEFFTKKMAKMTAMINGWAMNKCQLLLANSEHTKQEIQKIYKFHDSKVRVVYLGLGNVKEPVDPESVTDIELKRIGVAFKKFLFTIGTLEPRKNLPRLIESFAQVSKDLDTDFGLAIAGAKGWKESGIFQKLRELSMEDRVTFLGYVADDDVPKLFARCEFFVFPSTIEGFGIPALEALHFGAPLVCSNAGALPEVAGPDAVLFNPHSHDLMEGALKEGLARKDRREELVAKGKEFAKKFNWETTAKQTLDAVVKMAAK
jgi:glycosyltransferase involved in cell wall biosynthesis